MAAGGNIVEKLATAGNFTLHVAKADFKFNAAHFMLFSVEIKGPLGADGYVVDFSVLKRAVRSACKALDERTLIPLHCPSLHVVRLASAPQLQAGQQLSAAGPHSGSATAPSGSAASTGDRCPQPHIALTLPDGSTFVLPEADCCLLPVSNISVEELCVFLASQLGESLPLGELMLRGVQSITVGVQETPNQKAAFSIGLRELAERLQQTGVTTA